MPAEVVLDKITKRFAAAAVSDVSLEIEKAEIVVLVGPSGCGKSTTLRMVAGLEDPDDGDIRLGGKSMRGVAPQDRDLAMVFQSYALYPTMTAREILEFPLRMRGVDKAGRAKAVDDAASLLKISHLLDRRPNELSGGERQRVAMGRAIVRRPRVFLFDEPLSNLDAALRAELRVELGALVRRLEATAIYVTHDHVEAMTLADRIAVMKDGRVLQFAPPREIYERPASAFVGTFIGAPRMNVLPAVVEDGAVVAGPLRIACKRAGLPPRVEVGFRPADVRLDDAGGTPAEIVAVEPLGAETHLFVKVAGDLDLRVVAPGFLSHARGEVVRVSVDAEKIHLFDAARAGARIDAAKA